MLLKIIRLYVLPILIVWIICFFSFYGFSSESIPHFSFRIDWVFHFFAYFVFGGTLAFNVSAYYPHMVHNNSLWWFVLVPVLCGGVIEILQEKCFFPRTAEWGDFFMNTLGTVLAFLLLFLLKGKK